MNYPMTFRLIINFFMLQILSEYILIISLSDSSLLKEKSESKWQIRFPLKTN